MKPHIEARPRVSVAIPAYNAASTIEAAVQSALRQTVADIEVVVCNDASTDQTLKTLQSIEDSRLVVVNNPINQGEGKTRDNAIMEARGEWIAVLDADDVWDEQRIEKMLSATNGEADVMVFDDLLICHHTPSGLVPWRNMRGPKAFGGDGATPIDVATESWAASYQFLMKPIIHADTLRKSGIRHSTLKFGADTEYFLRLIAHGFRLRYIPEACYLYRITPNSASANSQRMNLMNGMLESMLLLFDDQPEVQRAIESRIQYRKLVQDLKEGRILDALRFFFSNPKAFYEFTSRAAQQALYLGHRRFHSGSPR